MVDLLLYGFVSFILCFILMPIALAIFKIIVPCDVINEGECHIYVLFGSVLGKVDEAGLTLLPSIMGSQAWVYAIFGKCFVIDMRWDQRYLRSLPVNSEEGAPMGIGVWYEMKVSDPIGFLFNNSDPSGSLKANVSNATVRCLSNLSLAEMMETRHQMSRTVRGEVSPHSNEWGYKLGSVYIRKVHFRDRGMIRQIEEKVVNRLRQVTAAITQDGSNQVNLIRSGADRQAAVAFAKAAACRPKIVGDALHKISEDPEVAAALFEVLENEKILAGNADVIMLPKGTDTSLMTNMFAAQQCFQSSKKASPEKPASKREALSLPKRQSMKSAPVDSLVDYDISPFLE